MLLPLRVAAIWASIASYATGAYIASYQFLVSPDLIVASWIGKATLLYATGTFFALQVRKPSRESATLIYLIVADIVASMSAYGFKVDQPSCVNISIEYESCPTALTGMVMFFPPLVVHLIALMKSRRTVIHS